MAFTLFRPGYWLDQISPPYQNIEPSKVFELIGDTPPNGVVTLVVKGPHFDSGTMDQTTILVNTGKPKEAVKRLEEAGLVVTVENGHAKIEEPLPQSKVFDKIGKMFDYYGDDPVEIAAIKKERERPAKELFYIPALILLGLVIFLQRRRRDSEPAVAQ